MNPTTCRYWLRLGTIPLLAAGLFALLVRGQGPAAKSDPRYYYRPWKTILVRTVADGGESYYVQGDHRVTVPALYHAALQAERNPLPG